VSDMQEQERERGKKKKFMFCEYSPKTTISDIVKKVVYTYLQIMHGVCEDCC